MVWRINVAGHEPERPQLATSGIGTVTLATMQAAIEAMPLKLRDVLDRIGQKGRLPRRASGSLPRTRNNTLTVKREEVRWTDTEFRIKSGVASDWKAGITQIREGN